MERSSLVSFLCLVFALAGCGGGKTVPVYPVTGKLTKGGQPLPGITVTFVQKDKQVLSVGLTNEEGKFVLISDNGKAGAVAGKSKVTLAKVAPTNSMGNPSSDPDFYKKMDKMRTGGPQGQPAKSTQEEIPFSADYGDAEKTPLSFDVKEGPNDFDIPLP